MWCHYVYIHRRASDGRIFYVGKGSHDDRMLDRSSRNPHWKNVVVKHGFTAHVVQRFASDALAQECERELIAWYGRKNLVNMTDGGDGGFGIEMSASARKKLSEHAKKPRGEAWIKSMREARRGGGNGGVVRAGDKLPEAWRNSIAAAKLGAKNPMHGKTGAAHHGSKRVIDTATGVEYPSITAAAKAAGISMQGLHNMLTGHRTNTSTMELA